MPLAAPYRLDAYLIPFQTVLILNIMTLAFFRNDINHYLPQNTNNDKKQDSHKPANKNGEEAQKETRALWILGSLRVKNKVNSNSKARIKSKLQ